MPESTKWKKRKKRVRLISLRTRTLRTVLIGALVLSIVAFIVGIMLYTDVLLSQHESKAFMLSQGAAKSARETVDVEKLTKKVMNIYNGLSDEERAKNMTKEYREKFESVTEDDEYYIFKTLLDFYKDYSNDIADVYYAVYDRKTMALVYVADPATEAGMVRKPGDYDKADKDELDTFLGWNGKGILYDTSDSSEYGLLCTAGTPIKDKAGRKIGFVLVDISLGKVLRGMGSFALKYFLAMISVVVLFAFLLMRHSKATLVEPINQISKAAYLYTKAQSSDDMNEKYFEKLDIRTGDEIENLSETMKEMESDISDYVKELKNVTAERERINTELNVAGNIQEGMLPNAFPLFPDREEFDVYASMNPAKEVGGDFYNIFMPDDDHLVMVIADVSGKGIPAALFMMGSTIMIRDYTEMDYSSPAKMLEIVNDKLYEYNGAEMFVTVWIGILELSTGKMKAANAGHEFPVIKRANGKFELFKDKHGFVLGGMDGMKYADYEIELQPGDILFEYTDGATEAVNDSNELFGTNRMIDSLNRIADETGEEISAKKLSDGVFDSIEEFSENAPQFDDITMLGLIYKGSKKEREAVMDKKHQLKIAACLDKLPEVIGFLDGFLEENGCSMRVQCELDIAVEEIFVNIAHYAYTPDEGEVVIDLERLPGDTKDICIKFTDWGVPYDPLAKPDPDITLGAEERQIGGLGIFIVKNTMDDMKYEYKDGSNVLTMFKTIE